MQCRKLIIIFICILLSIQLSGMAIAQEKTEEIAETNHLSQLLPVLDEWFNTAETNQNTSFVIGAKINKLYAYSSEEIEKFNSIISKLNLGFWFVNNDSGIGNATMVSLRDSNIYSQAEYTKNGRTDAITSLLGNRLLQEYKNNENSIKNSSEVTNEVGEFLVGSSGKSDSKSEIVKETDIAEYNSDSVISRLQPISNSILLSQNKYIPFIAIEGFENNYISMLDSLKEYKKEAKINKTYKDVGKATQVLTYKIGKEDIGQYSVIIGNFLKSGIQEPYYSQIGDLICMGSWNIILYSNADNQAILLKMTGGIKGPDEKYRKLEYEWRFLRDSKGKNILKYDKVKITALATKGLKDTFVVNFQADSKKEDNIYTIKLKSEGSRKVGLDTQYENVYCELNNNKNDNINNITGSYTYESMHDDGKISNKKAFKVIPELSIASEIKTDISGNIQLIIEQDKATMLDTIIMFGATPINTQAEYYLNCLINNDRQDEQSYKENIEKAINLKYPPTNDLKNLPLQVIDIDKLNDYQIQALSNEMTAQLSSRFLKIALSEDDKCSNFLKNAMLDQDWQKVLDTYEQITGEE